MHSSHVYGALSVSTSASNDLWAGKVNDTPHDHAPRARPPTSSEAKRGVHATGVFRVPTFVKCSKIASGRAALIGDAAHAVSPNIGMGCAAALQDGELLARACVAAGGDVSAAACEYALTRGPSVEALTHISQRLDAVQGFKYHRNPIKALIGFPYVVASTVGNTLRFQVPGTPLSLSNVVGIHAQRRELVERIIVCSTLVVSVPNATVMSGRMLRQFRLHAQQWHGEYSKRVDQ